MRQIHLILICILLWVNYSCIAQEKSKVNSPEDFSEYYYRISLLIDSAEINDNNLVVPKYFRDLDFLDGYEIPAFSAEVMNGEIKVITYKGKLTILNFWFISCPSLC